MAATAQDVRQRIGHSGLAYPVDPVDADQYPSRPSVMHGGNQVIERLVQMIHDHRLPLQSGDVTTGAGPAPRSAHENALTSRWRDIHARVAQAALDAGRDPADVAILLAAKTQTPATVRTAIAAGARLLGHNRVQELTAMAPELVDLDPTWHVIGPLQSNKVNAALAWATCVQTVADTPLADRLSRRCEAIGCELDVMVQVNVSGEATKAGVAPERAVELAAAVAAHENLRLTGLMTIGANSADRGLVRAGFARLRELRDELRTSGASRTADARELSMGMSGDFELAVAEGATLLRLGSAVFGPRA